MTDFSYGWDISPMQILIQRGHSSTMLTALRCGASLDAGYVYLKQPLSLHVSAIETFMRAVGLIERIVCEELMATPQQAKPVLSSRRTPAQNDLARCPQADLATWYDQIRMLDAEGFPPRGFGSSCHAPGVLPGVPAQRRPECRCEDQPHRIGLPHPPYV